MKKVLRNIKPACLKNYILRNHNWNSVTKEHKQEIRFHLTSMQGDFCAYCESKLDSLKHIEHFADKDSYPKLTFLWDNLFLSCGSYKHCGHFKDSNKAPNYNYLDLIKPDLDDPNDFLYYNSNGKVSCLNDLDDVSKKKATTTLEVFNLNQQELVNKRSTVLSSIKDIITYIYSLDDANETGELLAYYQKFYANTEFSTAKLQFLLPPK
ncbi:retron Ec78 anti-phage system effector HNH endonuclease PtuB [Acinetobacter guillouiae]|uniref:retron Ec78 anti-phage system effector HNH endonuclease PtuB n=1 Tax=Acinetobacter guillouiae TaxID=106649 RepID=UPI001CD43BDC|nr:retron Ec78 anti-phage system effector HNH endonuclease PtuB [Acinetobacter guillouiae]